MNSRLSHGFSIGFWIPDAASTADSGSGRQGIVHCVHAPLPKESPPSLPIRFEPPSIMILATNPTSALWCEEPLENQGPVDFSVTMRLASLPGFYWTYDLCRHPKRLVQNPLIWLGCPATTNPQNSVLVGRQNDRRDLVLRQQVAHRPP